MSDTGNDFGGAVKALGDGNLSAAERLFKRVLQTQPDHVAALNFLTIVLMRLARYAEAEAFIARAVALNSISDVSYYNYGLILKANKKPRQALEQFGHALRLNAAVAETWNNRGTVFNDLKQYENAISDFDRAALLAPHDAAARVNKGKSLSKLGRYDEALAAYNTALALKPDLAEALLGRGNCFAGLKRYDEAFADYDRALTLKPNMEGAWLGRGNVLLDLRRFDEAFAAYAKALAVRPDLAEAWLGIGNGSRQIARYDEALAAYDKGLALDAGMAEAWLGRGSVLKDLGRYGEALAAYDRALTLDPDLPGGEGSRLHVKMLLCDWSGFQRVCDHLMESVRHNRENSEPFVLLGINSSAEDQFNYTKLWARKKYPPASGPLWQGQIYRHSKIRIAYMSPDFRNHPLPYLAAGVFENHDRPRFEVTGISIGPDDNSDIRQRLEGSFDRFIDAKTLGAAEIAKKINELEIDILIDLGGFTQFGRTEILTFRSAPIQVNYLGYPGTMGVDYIDYIIGDRTLIPASDERFYAEKVVCLPHSYMPHTDKGREVADQTMTRRDFGLPEEGFVFCCFNNAYKLNPHVFRLWLDLLSSVDGSVLWLSEINSVAASNLRQEAAAAGISPERLIFAKRLPSMADHLARHRLADLFLDTVPYNAHTTASDALWAGLPVLTQIGETFAGRVAASLLNAIGLPELVTATPAEYKRVAVDLATHPEKLAAIARKLANNRLSMPLFDTKLFTRNIEAAYAAMHERYQAGLPPDHIEIAN